MQHIFLQVKYLKTIILEGKKECVLSMYVLKKMCQKRCVLRELRAKPPLSIFHHF